MSYLSLPDKKDALAEVIKRMVRAGESERNIRRVNWLVVHYYLQGARRFSGINYLSGSVKVRYESVSGELNFQYEDILRKLQAEMGRLMRIDIRPYIRKEGNFSLDGMRNASMGQAALDTMYRESRLEDQYPAFLQFLLKYGTAGLACWGNSIPRLGRAQPVVEVIPPWELLSVPANPASSAHVEAVMRVRWLPLTWLRDQKQLSIPSDDDMDTIDVPYGVHPEGYSAVGSMNSGAVDVSGFDVDSARKDESAGGTRRVMEQKAKDLIQTHAQTVEVFVPEPDGTLGQFVVSVGGKIVLNEKYVGEQETPMMPIGVARYTDAGGFYGRSFIGPLLPLNVEVEYLLKRLFENSQDLDQFGYLMIPADSGVQINQFKSTSRPRIVTYQPDLTTPEHKPYAISPTNTGDFPGKVANLGRDISREQAGQSEMMAGGAPGRVDSAQALGYLQESSNVPLSPVATSIASCLTTVYRAMLGLGRDRWPHESLARITLLDDSLVGVVLNPQDGRIVLDRNSIPYPLDVDVTIKASVPQSVQQRKMELLNLYQQQLVTAREFRWISRSEGLDFPLGSRAEYENRRKAILNNIILFGDGKTPGQVIVSRSADNPEIHLEVLNDFMARPEFTLASKEVRQAFEQRQVIYQQALGGLPEGMEYPEDEAALQSQTGAIGRILNTPEPPQAPNQGEGESYI